MKETKLRITIDLFYKDSAEGLSITDIADPSADFTQPLVAFIKGALPYSPERVYVSFPEVASA